MYWINLSAGWDSNPRKFAFFCKFPLKGEGPWENLGSPSLQANAVAAVPPAQRTRQDSNLQPLAFFSLSKGEGPWENLGSPSLQASALSD